MVNFNEAVMRNYNPRRYVDDNAWNIQMVLQALGGLAGVGQAVQNWQSGQRAEERQKWGRERQKWGSEEQDWKRLEQHWLRRQQEWERQRQERLSKEFDWKKKREEYETWKREEEKGGVESQKLFNTMYGEIWYGAKTPQEAMSNAYTMVDDPEVLGMLIRELRRSLPKETNINLGDMMKSLRDTAVTEKMQADALPEGYEKEATKQQLARKNVINSYTAMLNSKEYEDIVENMTPDNVAATTQKIRDMLELYVYKNLSGPLFQEERQNIERGQYQGFLNFVRDDMLATPEIEDPDSPEFIKRMIAYAKENRSVPALLNLFNYKNGKLQKDKIQEHIDQSQMNSFVSSVIRSADRENIGRMLGEARGLIGTGQIKSYMPFTTGAQGPFFNPNAEQRDPNAPQRVAQELEGKRVKYRKAFGPLELEYNFQKGFQIPGQYVPEEQRIGKMIFPSSSTLGLMGALDRILRAKGVKISKKGNVVFSKDSNIPYQNEIKNYFQMLREGPSPVAGQIGKFYKKGKTGKAVSLDEAIQAQAERLNISTRSLVPRLLKALSEMKANVPKKE